MSEITKMPLEIKKRFNYRQLFMILVVIFATAADVLMDYVNAGFDAAIFRDPSYWIKLALTCLSVILMTLAVRDFFREKEVRENSTIIEIQKLIDNAHTELVKRDLTTRFEEYVADINKERKRAAYRAFIQYKLTKIKNEKKRKYWLDKLDSADKDIECLPTKGNKIKFAWNCHIRFAKVRIATVFSCVERSSGDDEDIETNEQKHIAELVFKKLFMLISFSITFSTLFFDPGVFAVSILVKTFTKLFRTALSIFLGATDGQNFTRGTLLSKMKLRLDFIQKFIESEKNKRPTICTQVQKEQLTVSEEKAATLL